MTITSSTIPSPTISWTTSDRSAVRTRIRRRPSRPRRASERVDQADRPPSQQGDPRPDRRSSAPSSPAVSAATATDPTLTASELFIYPLPLVAMLASVVGILMFTGEAQHGTLAVALVARPARWVIVGRQDDHGRRQSDLPWAPPA